MKKIYLITGAALLSVSSFAQAGKAFLIEKKSFNHATSNNRMTAIDTTGIVNITDFLPEYNPNGTQSSFYGYVGGGKLYGNNADNLNACAQGYQNLNAIPVKIIGVMTWVGGKSSTTGASGGANSKIIVKAWNMAANKAYNTNGATPPVPALNSEGPSTTLASPIASVDVVYADIDTADFLYAAFATPVLVTGNFAVGVDFNTLAAGDTAGLVCDAVNSAGNVDLAFHNTANKWYVTDLLFSTSGSGEFDNDIAIWAVLADATGVNEYFNGMKLTTYPNPTTERATIEYTLEKNSNKVSLVVFDQAGRKVIEKAYDSQSAGTYKIDLETANLNAGTYMYQLNANGRNFTKQFVVTK